MTNHDQNQDPARKLADDPRFTAYALGELEGEQRAHFETELASDEDAQRELAELRGLAGKLETEMSAQPAYELSPTQRAAIVDSLTGASRAPHLVTETQPGSWRAAAGVLTAAASLAVGAWLLDRSAPDQLRSSAPSDPGSEVALVTPSPHAAVPNAESGGTTPGSTSLFPDFGSLDSESVASSEAESQAALFTRFSRERLDSNAVVNHLENQTLDVLASVVPNAGFPFDEGVVPERESWAELAEFRNFSVPGIRGAEVVQPSLGVKVAEIDHAILEVMKNEGAKRGSRDSEYKRQRLFELRDELTQLGTQLQVEPSNTEAYERIVENAFVRVTDEPLSTFSIDVDTASYANVRRFLTDGQLPPPDAVRIEELVNYFDYEYPPSVGPAPFSAHAEVAACPWAPEHRLVKIGLLGRSPEHAAHAAVAKNLVFLIDVSGSMQSHDKIELLKQGLRLLVPGLGDEDTVAIAVYAGASGLVLPATSDKATILAALDGLTAGGSTNGAAGIELAYQTATEHFRPEGTNRVILCTDGDFNVGVTSQGDLQRLIEEKRETGVFLSVLGFGSGNLKDSTMETLANHGNGVYYYIDSLREAEKVLVRDLHATLETIAKDVKIQVEFNPAEVSEYRLIGYENRALAAQDFNDDTKDAGEIGAGHTVTAFYEVVPQGSSRSSAGTPAVDDLKYQPSSAAEPSGVKNGELLTVKLRYKQPTSDTSTKLELPVMATNRAWTQTSEDFRFAAGVALFGMCLRGSEHTNGATLGTALELAQEGAGPDPWGYRAEFLSLVQRAIELR